MKVNLLKESRIFRQAGSLVLAAFVGLGAFSMLSPTPSNAFTPPTPPPQRTPTPTPTPTPGTTPNPSGPIATTVICYHGMTMTVRNDQLGGYSGYTTGPCPTPPPTSGN